MPRVNAPPSVALYIRISDHKGRRHYERVSRRNPQSGGIFCLHYFSPEGKRTWLTVGRDINQAQEARFKKESELRLQQKEGSKPAPAAPQTLEELRETFLHDKRTTFKKDGFPLDPDTITSYEKVTREFLDIVKRTLPSEITRQDLRDWIANQRERVSHRTVCNRYVSIACFLHFCEVDHKKLLPQNERPTPVEDTPEAYTRQEMDQFFFTVVRERDALAFELYLKAGPRERELTNLEWSDLNLGPEPVVHFRTKRDFRTTTGKSRVVPLAALTPQCVLSIHSFHSLRRRLEPEQFAMTRAARMGVPGSDQELLLARDRKKLVCTVRFADSKYGDCGKVSHETPTQKLGHPPG